ncbi:MAG: hypothetical protein KBA61_06915 [Spirochaetes bacterium]|nr:hypothetical protein [Spirochaetota bacterium]
MIRSITHIAVVIALALPLTLSAATINSAVGIYGGIAPSLGNNLQSGVQYYIFDSQSGIDGMNRSTDGTSSIDRLLGVSGGIAFKMLFMEYYQLRIAGNYTRSVSGGEGTSMYNDGADHLVDCEYSFLMYDVPVTIGLSIPFWKDIKIAFSCGLAYAYATYTNEFDDGTTVYKGEFTGWGLPLVILLEGEYFVTDRIAVSSSLIYYRGSTKLIEDDTTSDGITDYAKLNFTGYRYNAGITFYFMTI